MAWIEYVTLLAAGLFGILLVALTWPGLWLMAMACLVYALLTRERYLGFKTLAVVFVLALAAEIAEIILGKIALNRAGAGRAAGIGAAVGGLAGGIFLTFVPIPIVSTIAGICIGTFVGAAVAELYASHRPRAAIGAGWGAASARIWALAVKLVVGGLIFVTVAWTAWP